MYHLDTNALSALMAGDARVAARVESLDRESVAVSQPVLAEIAYGIARLRSSRRKTWLAQRLSSLTNDMMRVGWTDDVSREFGRIKAHLERAGTRMEDFDVAIAAHALAHGATLVTSNTEHMKRVAELALEDWTAPE